MIFDLSDKNFKSVFHTPEFFLPIRWDGRDFEKTLCALYEHYERAVSVYYNDKILTRKVRKVCRLIIRAVNEYLDGFPAKAFATVKTLMNLLMKEPLEIYEKSVLDQFYEKYANADPLKLYRVVGVPDNMPYDRKRVFHTPYHLRSKISTNRYSIAGYPSLYLGTSLELCCEETRLNPYENFALASRFQIERNYKYNEVHINVVELAVKPQDFFEELGDHQRYGKRRRINPNLLKKNKDNYLSWYPLIAACSYIRVNKKEPFAVEYVIPQLIMQWIREENAHFNKKNIKEDRGYNHFDALIGIRYFSCASERASEMGFNYVFPTSGTSWKDLPYCPILTNSFKLTVPKYIHEFCDTSACQRELEKDMNLDYIK
jgi:hypothetical protein